MIVPLTVVVEGLPSRLSGTAIAGFGHLSLVATAGAFLLWFGGIRRLPATAPPLLGIAAPVTGVVVGWLLLGQALGAVQLVGLAVALGAIVHGALARDHPTERGSATVPTSARPGITGVGDEAVPTPVACAR